MPSPTEATRNGCVCAQLDAQGMKRNEKPKPTPFYMSDPAHQNRSDTQHRSS